MHPPRIALTVAIAATKRTVESGPKENNSSPGQAIYVRFSGSGIESSSSAPSVASGGDRSLTRVLANFSELQRRFWDVLGDRKPLILRSRLGGQGAATCYLGCMERRLRWHISNNPRAVTFRSRLVPSCQALIGCP